MAKVVLNQCLAAAQLVTVIPPVFLPCNLMSPYGFKSPPESKTLVQAIFAMASAFSTAVVGCASTLNYLAHTAMNKSPMSLDGPGIGFHDNGNCNGNSNGRENDKEDINSCYLIWVLICNKVFAHLVN